MEVIKKALMLTSLSIIGCSDSDNVHDDSLEDAIAREYLCLAASEMFLLYDDAERHLKHLRELEARNWQENRIENNSKLKIQLARTEIDRAPKEYSAKMLMDNCDTRIPKTNFNSVY